MLAVLLFALVLAGMAAFWLVAKIQGFELATEISSNDNPAVGLRYAFFLFGLIVSLSMVMFKSASVAANVRIVLIYGLPVIGLMLLSVFVTSELMFRGLDTHVEIIQKKNSAIALVEAAAYMATALIISATLSGFEDHPLDSAAWLGIGELGLVILVLSYRGLVHGVFSALRHKNHACALSLVGLILAAGLAVSAAVSGPSTTLGEDLGHGGMYLAGWAIMMFAAHFFANWLAVPRTSLRREVIEQSNTAAGVLEAVFYVGVTLLYALVVG